MHNVKLLLVILDGFGIGPLNEHNAIWQARTPFFDSLIRDFPHTQLSAAGEAVGTLPGQIGTSEVGHLNIGAGRVVYQDIARIHQAITDQTFFSNPAFLKAIAHAKKHNSTLHLIGLLSPGGVHSHTKHLYALLELAKRQSVQRVAIHAFLDGRDTPPASALPYVRELEDKLARHHPQFRLATLMGRFWGMDRNQNWERTVRAFGTLTQGQGAFFDTAGQAIEHAYLQGKTDEFIEPCVLVPPNSSLAIKNNDAIIFFNFRADRMRQLVNAFLNRNTETSKHQLQNLWLTSMTSYEDKPRGVQVAYPTTPVNAHLSATLSALNLSQFKIAETEKYAHLTYFFNGGRETSYTKEERLMIPSSSQPDFTKIPEMSTPKITAALLPILQTKDFPFVAVNFCNADMLGHTGNIAAAKQGIEIMDQCLKRTVLAARQNGYTIMITADHGNAEEMYIPELKSTHTAHTINPVPCLIVSEDTNLRLAAGGALANVAPTILELMHLEKPNEMTAKSLLV
ncbi:2,3-bisphosphoglycerate-independent phosphoglycerate mutase [Candidatus Uhrbacteria bacterium]|nr:2,3-bisphosphoglycerate-independent phosphoglycerate mutase [Candidatus Uhrbacteria bacterium]